MPPELQGPYAELLRDLKDRVRGARLRAALAVNHELLRLYWDIGCAILEAQAREGYGTKVVERLSVDLRREFPDMQGLSARNVQYMRAFAQAWPDFGGEVVQQTVAQLPWGHNLTLIDKLPDAEAREWYARAALTHGWSRNVLALQIETRLRERQGQALTNFARTLPAPHADLARDTLKDPYKFDFLTLGQEASERDLERGLLAHLQHFMLELGVGFAFVGSQYHLEVGGQDYYLDLLFYHLRLRCYVVIDLKVTAFRPEYAGKMNFYLSAVDDLLQHETDSPSIGLILCREHNRVVVEYALRDLSKPLGVSSFELTEALPQELKGVLPTVEQLEAQLMRGEDEGS